MFGLLASVVGLLTSLGGSVLSNASQRKNEQAQRRAIEEAKRKDRQTQLEASERANRQAQLGFNSSSTNLVGSTGLGGNSISSLLGR